MIDRANFPDRPILENSTPDNILLCKGKFSDFQNYTPKNQIVKITKKKSRNN